MHVKIEKLPTGRIAVELTADTAKKPLKVELESSMVDAIIQTLKTARSAERFRFELDV